MGMGLFPPWKFVYGFNPPSFYRAAIPLKAERAAGYHYILFDHTPTDQTELAALFGLPKDWTSEPKYFDIQIDTTRLGTQLIAVAVCLGLLYVLIGEISHERL
jgi:hypothetical protein